METAEQVLRRIDCCVELCYGEDEVSKSQGDEVWWTWMLSVPRHDIIESSYPSFRRYGGLGATILEAALALEKAIAEDDWDDPGYPRVVVEAYRGDYDHLFDEEAR